MVVYERIAAFLCVVVILVTTITVRALWEDEEWILQNGVIGYS